MYKVNQDQKQLIPLAPTQFSVVGVLERFDLQEWIDGTPAILGEDIFIIAKELPLPSRIRLDLLGLDKQGRLVVIELKRDDSGHDVEWQAIKYASYCSNFLPEDIYRLAAAYLQKDEDEAELAIEEFLEVELEDLNQSQRIILVAQSFHSDVASAVLWLRDFDLDISCLRLRAYQDEHDELFIVPDVIIPLPEAQDYVQRKEAKQKEIRRGTRSTFSMEKGNFDPAELEERWRKSLTRSSDLTPRFIAFLEVLMMDDGPSDREEIKEYFVEKGIGNDIGQAGRYLSGVSQFITKKSNTHLRQVISFDSAGGQGDYKNNYRIEPEYRDLLGRLLSEIN